MKLLILSAILAICLVGTVTAFANPINFNQCANNPNHHCYSFSPQLNQATGTNTHITAHFPQNGSPIVDGIFDSTNYTNFKQNIAVIAVENIYSTTASPTLNYCPVAKITLTNQGVPSYLNLFYDPTKSLDRTSSIYPNYCFVETGANPINGQGNITPTPPPVSTLTVTTASKIYSIGDTIKVSGTSPSQTPDITLMVIAPNNNIVTISQTTAIGGTFNTSIQTGGTLWQQSGIYTIKATQGTSTATTQFTLTTTIPEFPLAQILLVISITTMIVITSWRKH